MAILHVSHAQTKTPLKLEFLRRWWSSDLKDMWSNQMTFEKYTAIKYIPLHPPVVMVARVLAVADDHFWVPTLEESPQSVFGTAEVTHHVFSGVAMVAQRQLSEGPSNPPRKHTSRYSHCVKPVATKVMFGSSMVSYQPRNAGVQALIIWQKLTEMYITASQEKHINHHQSSTT